MKSTKTVPIKRGEFVIQENILHEHSFKKGIYRAIVETGNKCFRYNKNNYYNSEDLNNAKLTLNLKVTIIEDGEYNGLIYTPEKCIRLSTLFKGYIDSVFKLKQCKIPGAKELLTIVWGALNEKNTAKTFINTDTDTEFKIPENHTFRNIRTVAPNLKKFIWHNELEPYKGYLPRTKCFITSMGRGMIYKLVNRNEIMDKVKIIATDGLVTTEQIFETVLPSVKTIGDLVYEGMYINCSALDIARKDSVFIKSE
jgi:hypothetical protein